MKSETRSAKSQIHPPQAGNNPEHQIRTRFTLTVLLAAALAAGPGCVKKSISVCTDPPGALVYIDGLEAGKAPVHHVPFHFYGTRQIAVYKNGYLPEKRTVTIKTPWYSCFPIDIFTELIIPWDIADRRDYYFALKRAEPIERAALMRHAHQTREVARTRIESARRDADYKPRKYVVKDAEKPFVLWGWLLVPPRGEPVYLGEKAEPEKKPKKEK